MSSIAWICAYVVLGGVTVLALAIALDSAPRHRQQAAREARIRRQAETWFAARAEQRLHDLQTCEALWPDAPTWPNRKEEEL